MSLFKIRDIGLTSYSKALEIQKECVVEVGENNLPGIIILCEHHPVYTLGKSANPDNFLANSDFLKSMGAEVHQTDRGGDITFHGPGQLVVYPIINLSRFPIGIRAYVCCLERSLISLLARYGISASCVEGLTGVWLPANQVSTDRKIAAIGIRVSRGITSHGIALNVNNDLSFFDHIIPCGIKNKTVTSMEKELGLKQDFDAVKREFTVSFEKVLLNGKVMIG